MPLLKKDFPYKHWELISPTTGDRLRIVPERGGLITEWRSNNREILYFDRERFAQLDKSVRGGIPILFPICGNLSRNVFRLKKGEFRMGQHGFARDSQWQIKPLEDYCGISLNLLDNKETNSIYPFLFSLEIKVRLESNQLKFFIYIENKSKEIMPFSFGLHPYFNVANLSKIKLEGLLDTCTNYLDISQSKSEKQLTSLKKGVDFLSGPSKLISLIDFEAGSRLELKHYPPMDLTVVWTDPPRSMICVEPWTSPRDSLLTRDRIIELDAGEMQTLRCTFSAYDEI